MVCPVITIEEQPAGFELNRQKGAVQVQMITITIQTSYRSGPRGDVIGVWSASSTGNPETIRGEEYLKNTDGSSYCGPTRGGSCDYERFENDVIQRVYNFYGVTDSDTVYLNGECIRGCGNENGNGEEGMNWGVIIALAIAAGAAYMLMKGGR